MKIIVRKGDIAILIPAILFGADNAANYFAPIPVYAASLPLTIALFTWGTPNRSGRLFIAFVFFLVAASFLLNAARYGVVKEDLSDAMFLVHFFAALIFCFYGNISGWALSLISWAMFALFVPTLWGMNAGSWDSDVFNSGSVDLEYFRVYHQGLYRFPHLAAYMLTLGGLWWAHKGIIQNKIISYIAALIFFLAAIYTGSRTPVIVLAFGIVFAHVKLSVKSATYTALFAVMAVTFAWQLGNLLDYTYGTFLFQYLSFFQTAAENWDRLSRIIIWSNWWAAISNFSFLDWLIGSTYTKSLEFNGRMLGQNIWFHNDFLSVAYCYGLFIFALYIGAMGFLYVKVARARAHKIFMVSVFFIIASAFVNGFYKYMPVLFFAVAFRYKVTETIIGVGLKASRRSVK